jgi:hypothetical protein
MQHLTVVFIFAVIGGIIFGAVFYFITEGYLCATVINATTKDTQGEETSNAYFRFMLIDKSNGLIELNIADNHWKICVLNGIPYLYTRYGSCIAQSTPVLRFNGIAANDTTVLSTARFSPACIISWGDMKKQIISTQHFGVRNTNKWISLNAADLEEYFKITTSSFSSQEVFTNKAVTWVDVLKYIHLHVKEIELEVF